MKYAAEAPAMPAPITITSASITLMGNALVVELVHENRTICWPAGATSVALLFRRRKHREHRG
jgi:hypothetical protein